MNNSKLYSELLTNLGEYISRDGLVKTPDRATRAMEFLAKGYDQDLDDVINGAVFDSDNDEMVVVKDIEMDSLCKHHLLPFLGKVHVAYFPEGKVIGLSRVVLDEI